VVLPPSFIPSHTPRQSSEKSNIDSSHRSTTLRDDVQTSLFSPRASFPARVVSVIVQRDESLFEGSEALAPSTSIYAKRADSIRTTTSETSNLTHCNPGDSVAALRKAWTFIPDVPEVRPIPSRVLSVDEVLLNHPIVTGKAPPPPPELEGPAPVQLVGYRVTGFSTNNYLALSAPDITSH
jgi:hypothetical protein